MAFRLNKFKSFFIKNTLLLILVLFFFVKSISFAGVCGDGVCEQEEACQICPQDCLNPDVVCCKGNSPINGHCADYNCLSKENCSSANYNLLRSGSMPKWSKKNNLIAFTDFVNIQGDSLGCNMFPLACNYEVLVIELDTKRTKCLTCGKQKLPNGHKGQPYWHPSGDYIVFTAENTDYPRFKKGFDMTVMPGVSGRNNNVWIMTSDGSKFWQVTDIKEGGGSIRPSFSPDGKTLYWNEEYSIEKYGQAPKWSVKDNPLGEEWGLWRIVLADMDFSSRVPKISNIRKVDINKLYPNKVFIEGQGIQPDNNTLIFSAADISETAGCCRWGWPPEESFGYAHWSDIYITDINGNNLKRITKTPYNHNENSEYSPSGEKLAFSETRWCVGKNAELYISDNNGGDLRQLTSFFNPNCLKSIGKFGGSGELDWSPDGKKIICGASIGLKRSYPYINEFLYLIDVEGEDR